MPKKHESHHHKEQAEKTAEKNHKNARSSHGLDSFFSRSPVCRESKRRDLIQASWDATGDKDFFDKPQLR